MIEKQFVQTSRRLDWLDQMKGLAIFSIVIFHFFQFYPKELEFIAVLYRLGARIALAAVDLFFVVAGFTTSYMMIRQLQKHNLSVSSIDFKSWLIKRLFRVYPAYLLAGFCSLLLYFIFKKFPPFNLDLILSILGLADYKTQVINPGFWFFRVLLQAYLIMPLILPLAIRNPKIILFIGILGGAIVKIIGLSLPHTSWVYPYFLQNNSIGSYWLQLCLGLYWGAIYYYKNDFRKIDYFVSIISLSLGSALFFILPSLGINVIYKLGIDLFVSPLIFLLVYLFFTVVKERLKAFKFMNFGWDKLSLLGIYSYQIYLIHQPLYLVIFAILVKPINVNSYVKFFSVLGLTIPLLIAYVIMFTHLENGIMRKISFLA
ncbi:acyltransferase [Chroococcus sp. FPU101]|uniref:acyltransferase family protein n=1 Tax=Chroococcus sp. FPU101 TaxID=1974212 RepID=UPI001A8DF2A3|nr:acyltransferase [Chroococcus sp. FPU101]GFE70207.1 putative acyltransferase [Chroococcus sp. FPU101]